MVDTNLEIPLVDTFFQHIFPDVTGHAQLLDENSSDPRASFHDTYIKDSILFDNPYNSDPDWKVKQGFTLVIAAACKIENGVDNLWKSGPSGGRHKYPDFGQYMPKNEFKCFQSAITFYWADKKEWYRDGRDIPWEVFLPCVSKFSTRHKNLIKTVCLMSQ
jgi:hypothetical protein